MTNNQLTDKRSQLRKAAQNYQIALAWYQSNIDSPAALQAWDAATAVFMAAIGNRETDIIADLFDEITELQAQRKVKDFRKMKDSSTGEFRKSQGSSTIGHKTHELKVDPIHYAAVVDGLKVAELRLNDRDYQSGDELVLREFDRCSQNYTGEQCTAYVQHVADVGELAPGYVLLSIELLEEKKTS